MKITDLIKEKELSTILMRHGEDTMSICDDIKDILGSKSGLISTLGIKASGNCFMDPIRVRGKEYLMYTVLLYNNEFIVDALDPTKELLPYKMFFKSLYDENPRGLRLDSTLSVMYPTKTSAFYPRRGEDPIDVIESMWGLGINIIRDSVGLEAVIDDNYDAIIQNKEALEIYKAILLNAYI